MSRWNTGGADTVHMLSMAKIMILQSTFCWWAAGGALHQVRERIAARRLGCHCGGRQPCKGAHTYGAPGHRVGLCLHTWQPAADRQHAEDQHDEFIEMHARGAGDKNWRKTQAAHRRPRRRGVAKGLPRGWAHRPSKAARRWNPSTRHSEGRRSGPAERGDYIAEGWEYHHVGFSARPRA